MAPFIRAFYTGIFNILFTKIHKYIIALFKAWFITVGIQLSFEITFYESDSSWIVGIISEKGHFVKILTYGSGSVIRGSHWWEIAIWIQSTAYKSHGLNKSLWKANDSLH